MENLYHSLDSLYEEIVQIRRHLHQHPELSFQEVHTPKYIAEYHEKLGHRVRTNVGGNGVVAYLQGGKPGPTVAMRADFDALPIKEETGLPFQSQNEGVMHACGHDAHTATLLGLAKALNGMKEELEGTVVFIHQHAEEVIPGGAKLMIEDGCLDGVDVIFGTHIQAQTPLGEVNYRVGPLQAAADFFEIDIQGKGGHGAYPHQTKDSIVIGSQLVNNLQQIVSRKVDPLHSAVVSVGSFEAINANNVIADTAELKGTVRTFDEGVRDLIEAEMERVVSATCELANAKGVLHYRRGYPSLVTHEKETLFVANLAEGIPGVEVVQESPQVMGGEDFSYYLQQVKGTFFFTGAEINGRKSPIHIIILNLILMKEDYLLQQKC
ncbi:N-acyl-L-amino acid amidohydrolase [Oceanobacillus iheyensis HTE831]|uniref:N-acyl-L-amino acid amidohydrolase n=1 Tax=Oceanobacillus iheyensis (strain DSM 14371 / CIP 107618 / JCM 11309 / KCTC 3954 / HTE831) TaxID=221109 RepID=Q8EMP7_OCEIH|nr:N-acyl-L-amino acid amidohydrolase [Oceanobacillus iheyensis HTE831]